MKRPGQWGERARVLRRWRQARSRARAQRRTNGVLNRATRRQAARFALERRAFEWGLAAKSGEPTRSLALRLRVRQTDRPTFTKATLEAMTGGVADVVGPGHVRVTLPADTTPERWTEVETIVREHTPITLLIDVVRAQIGGR